MLCRIVWRWLSKTFLPAVLLLSLLVAPRADAFRYVKVGDPAPPLVVEDLAGMEVKPSFFDKLTILLFFRPGQPFSLEALRDLKAVTEELQGKGIEVLAIADPSSKPGDLIAFIKEQGFPFPFFVDKGHQAEEAYGVIVFPSTGIVGKDGRLVFYLPSRNSNYREIIGGELKVLLGLMKEEEFTAKLALLGEAFGDEWERAQDRYRTGLALFREGKKEEAARELAEAIRLVPRFQDAHLQLGHVLLELGDPKGALREFEFVKEGNPLSPSARIGIGIAFLRLGELDKGIQLLEEAVSLNPDPVRGYSELGRAYEAKGDLAKALYAYKRAIKKLLQGRK